MSRHSKNNTANPVFTYAERKMIKDFGTQNARIGSDSQKPFEFCYLCVSKVIEPMTCHKGHMFCKECIINNMMKQKKENQKLMEAYEKKKIALELQKQAEEQQSQKKKEQDFEILDYYNDVNGRKCFKSKVEEKLAGYINHEQDQKVKALERLQMRGREMLTTTKKELINKNFWVPEAQPQSQEEELQAPKNVCLCPASKDHEIKVKKLFKVQLNDFGQQVYCYSCNKTIKYQKVGMSKHCGHVMCLGCIEKICLPEGRCMVCSKSFEKADIIQLQEAHSGFASHNPVEVTIFNPVMLI